MIRFVLLGIVVVYIQYFSADNISIIDLTPNILLPFIIYLSIFKKANAALIFSFIFGIILDLNNPPSFGITTFNFVIIAFILINIKSMINKGQILAYFSVILMTNFVFFLSSNLIIYIFQINQTFPITKILILSLYNTVISIIIILILFNFNKLKISFKDF